MGLVALIGTIVILWLFYTVTKRDAKKFGGLHCPFDYWTLFTGAGIA